MAESMRCTLAETNRCACSLVTATGGECAFGPRPTFAGAFPYLAESGEAGAR